MTQVKVILVVLGLLATGFVGGFLTHRYLARQQVERVRELGRPRGFADHLFRLIEPTEEQREQLSPIMERYGERFAVASEQTRQARKQLVDSMHQEIKPLLRQDQVERLENFSRRWEKRRKKDRMRGKNDPAGQSNE